jgi:hypothetical protein
VKLNLTTFKLHKPYFVILINTALFLHFPVIALLETDFCKNTVVWNVIFEKIIYTRLYQHVINNNTLSSHQHWFRRNSSTEEATFKLLNDILQALNNKVNVDGNFCDLEQAFN